MVYKRSDLSSSRAFSCLVQDDHERMAEVKPTPSPVGTSKIVFINLF